MMKKLILSTVLFLAGMVFTACEPAASNSGNATANAANKPASNSATAPAGDTAAAEAEVKKLIDATQAALSKNDADAMEKIYGDNYMTVNIDGSVQNKKERLEAIRTGGVKYDAFAFSDQTIRVNPEGTGAIVISKLTLKGTFKGKPMDGNYRVTGIYSKTKDGWKLVGSQTTDIAAGADTPKTDDNMAEANSNKPANK